MMTRQSNIAARLLETSAPPPSRIWIDAAAVLAGGLTLGAIAVAVLASSPPEESVALTRAAAPVARPDSDFRPVATGAASGVVPEAVARIPAAQLVLHGVLGGPGERAAAIIGRPDGSQMLVRIGREIVPGVVLKAVERAAIVLVDRGRAVRLGFAGQAPGNNGGHSAGDREDPRDATLDFKLGLAPRSDGGGQVTGFAVKPGAEIPIFVQAGLAPGDVVVGVNGRAFTSEDEVNKLAGEIALSPTIVFSVDRGGKIEEVQVETR